MKDKFLTKKTKISLKEETPPNGKREYEKIHKKDGDINEKALKDISTKLKDYYGFLPYYIYLLFYSSLKS